MKKKITGGWKVAYIDFFVTLSMLFLVLWAHSSWNSSQRQVLQRYFLERGYYNLKHPYPATDEQGLIIDEIKEKILKELDMSSGVKIDKTNVGIRINLSDSLKCKIFVPGESSLTYQGKQLIHQIGKRISHLPNYIRITSYAFSINDKEKFYSNWELSAERANNIRRELIHSGIHLDKIHHITTYACTARDQERVNITLLLDQIDKIEN